MSKKSGKLRGDVRSYKKLTSLNNFRINFGANSDIWSCKVSREETKALNNMARRAFAKYRAENI